MVARGATTGPPDITRIIQRMKNPMTEPETAGDDNLRMRWAWVINPFPLTIQFDGESTTVPARPSTLVAPTALLTNTRVLVLVQGRKFVVIGTSGGLARTIDSDPWQDISLEPGVSARSSASDVYRPQVKLDGGGMVHFRGQFDALSGKVDDSGSSVKLGTLPEEYAPETEVRWIGFQTTQPSRPYGGWITRLNGEMYMRIESTTPKVPTYHFCVILSPWTPTIITDY